MIKKNILENKDKITIKQFRDGSSNFWVDHIHYHLNEEGEIIFCAGGIDKQELRDYLLAFIRRNKKTFKAREKSIFEQEEIEYSKISFGKFAGLSTVELVATNRKYAKWLYENSADKKIKEELKQLLKIK